MQCHTPLSNTKSSNFWMPILPAEHFLVSPLLNVSLLLEDKTGEQIAFGFLDNEVQEILIPPPAKPEDGEGLSPSFPCA